MKYQIFYNAREYVYQVLLRHLNFYSSYSNAQVIERSDSHPEFNSSRNPNYFGIYTFISIWCYKQPLGEKTIILCRNTLRVYKNGLSSDGIQGNYQTVLFYVHSYIAKQE